MKTLLSPRAQLILSMLIFGTIGVVRRFIPFPSSVVALVRAAVGLVFLLLLRLLRRQRVDGAAVRRNLVKLLILGVMLGANWIFLFEAYNHTSVAAATMCYYMAPVFVILLSPVIFGEKITLRKGICSAVALFGMVLVSDVLSSGLHGAKGLLLGLIAASLYAAIVIVNRTLSGISAEDRTIMQFAVAAAVMLPYVLLTEDLSALTFTPSVTALLLLVGVVHTGFAYVLYFGSIPRVPAQTAALLSYLDPVVAVILSLTVLHEPMSLSAAIGAVLVLGAMLAARLPSAEAFDPLGAGLRSAALSAPRAQAGPELAGTPVHGPRGRAGGAQHPADLSGHRRHDRPLAHGRDHPRACLLCVPADPPGDLPADVLSAQLPAVAADRDLLRHDRDDGRGLRRDGRGHGRGCAAGRRGGALRRLLRRPLLAGVHQRAAGRGADGHGHL